MHFFTYTTVKPQNSRIHWTRTNLLLWVLLRTTCCRRRALRLGLEHFRAARHRHRAARLADNGTGSIRFVYRSGHDIRRRQDLWDSAAGSLAGRRAHRTHRRRRVPLVRALALRRSLRLRPQHVRHFTAWLVHVPLYMFTTCCGWTSPLRSFYWAFILLLGQFVIYLSHQYIFGYVLDWSRGSLHFFRSHERFQLEITTYKWEKFKPSP